MWEFFIKNNKFSYLLIVALVGLGVFSIFSIPRESSPEVVIPVGVVSTSFPGAPAADVEKLITNEIERGLTGLQNVESITSTSREGLSSVVVEFEASADVPDSIQALKDEIDLIRSSLPDEANDPVVLRQNFSDFPILTVALAADISDLAFNEITKEVERDLETISGVSRVEFSGVKDREVSIIVNQTALSNFGISLNQVNQALRNANLTFPVGQIVNDDIIYNVAFEGDISDSTQLPDIAIATRNGQPIFVRDIAVVEDGLVAGTTLSRLSVEGSPSVKSVSFNVFKQSGGDITKITSAVNSRIDELRQPGEILDGFETTIVNDSGQLILDDLVKLSLSGLQTVALVILLLIFTVGLRESILAGISIPLSIIIGFIGLYFSGNTINFLSLFSLILGVGILVDSSIVMIEGIDKKIKDNPKDSKEKAAIDTIKEFSAPLISGTLTTISMFVGLFVVSGVTGQFISSIPFTLVSLLVVSLFVSLAILPLLAKSFLKDNQHQKIKTKGQIKRDQLIENIENWYKLKIRKYINDEDEQAKFLSLIFAGLVFAITLAVNIFIGLIAAPLIYFSSLKAFAWQKNKNWKPWKRRLAWYPILILILVFSTLVSNFALPSFNPVKVTFFETSDADSIIIEIENPQGTTKEETDIDVRRIEEYLYDENEIEAFIATVGSGSSFGSGGNGEKFANIFVKLSTDRNRTSSEISDDLREQLSDLKDVNFKIVQPSDGPPTGAPIVIKFLGEDLTELSRLANGSAQILRDTEGAINIETSANDNSNEFVLTLDQAKAAALGLSPFEISQIARTAVFGSTATNLTTLNEDIDVVVKLNVANRSDINNDNSDVISIDALAGIQLPTTSGTVPLSSLVEISLRESNSVISHESGKRVVTVTADVAPGVNSREIQAAAISTIRENLDIGNDIELSTGGGESEESNRSFAELGLALIVGVVLMIAVLTLQFNSYLHMGYVISVLPYSLIGIFIGLGLTFNPLSFPSIMGFIALSGIVVNNSILLIDMMNHLRRKDPKRDIHDVVLEAAGSRLRPILLTTLTTVIGMIPLAFAGDLWAPLAYAVMFGLVFSVLITLVLIPIIYSRNPGKVNRELKP
jgi:HAE1 family hydrophobic/amphiphilic exporter-1